MRQTWQPPYDEVPEYLRIIDPVLTKIWKPNSNAADPGASYAILYLQRLSNPTAPYDAEANPYRTVDRASTNLTVFNSRGPDGRRGFEEPDYPYTEMPPRPETYPNTNGAREKFAAHERGYTAKTDNVSQPDTRPIANIWAYEPPSDERQQGDNGYLASPTIPTNAQVRPVTGARDFGFSGIPFCTLGFINPSFQQNGATQRLTPEEPFPWMPWGNRPFVSGNELMLVPRVRSSQLLNTLTLADNSNQAAYDSPTVTDPNPQRRDYKDDVHTPFVHFENFLFDKEPSGGPEVDQPSHMYRLLEFVQTPSLFAGSSTWLNPQMMTAPINSVDDPRYTFRPPFNNVSQHREPGRVNLNTVFSPAVYGGLFHSQDTNNPGQDVKPDGDGMVHPGPEWDDFYVTRRGYDVGAPGGAPGDMLSFDPNADPTELMPTFFVNPFRASGAHNLVPLDRMVQRDGSEARGVECTLFRSDDEAADDVDDEPLFASETNDDHNEWERNAFFRFAPMTRLDNLTSSQSNVFAVWITVGFFEVEPVAISKADFGQANGGIQEPALTQLYNRVYPDGVMLGKEDGLDEGDVRRLRGFYIIDRSRPAGFVPGQDANAETTIRLHRRIE
jgi:hypothetical protein